MFARSPRPKLSDGYPQYTNCIITLIWSDGMPRSLPILFTNDPKFRNSKITTTRRKEIRSRTDVLMDKYQIQSWQVFWFGGKSHFIRESRHLLELYGSMVQVPENSVIFHDQGNAFIDDIESIIPLIFGCRSATYSPIIHQYLSPNDNHYHGSTKAKWRSMAAEMNWDKDHSTESRLSLLSVLTHFNVGVIASYFTKNFFFERKKIQPDRCFDLVSSGLHRKLKKKQYYNACLKAYDSFKNQISAASETPLGSPPQQLENSLDGVYWEKK